MTANPIIEPTETDPPADWPRNISGIAALALDGAYRSGGDVLVRRILRAAWNDLIHAPRDPDAPVNLDDLTRAELDYWQPGQPDIEKCITVALDAHARSWGRWQLRITSTHALMMRP